MEIENQKAINEAIKPNTLASLNPLLFKSPSRISIFVFNQRLLFWPKTDWYYFHHKEVLWKK